MEHKPKELMPLDPDLIGQLEEIRKEMDPWWASNVITYIEGILRLWLKGDLDKAKLLRTEMREVVGEIPEITRVGPHVPALQADSSAPPKADIQK
jgi:hypothetical protein